MMLGQPRPRVIGLIGCPGAGKSTFTHSLDPTKWVTITLDDWRAALWPPHRRVYWDVRESDKGRDAQQLLHRAQCAALKGALTLGWNVVLADTHIRYPSFKREVQIASGFGVSIEWKFLDVPLEVLLERNKTRPLDHRVPDDLLAKAYQDLHAPDAWWRRLKSQRIEMIPYVAQKEAA